MKNLFSLFILPTLIGFTIFTGCGPNKKLQASKAQVEQLKKDSIETHRGLENEKQKTANAKAEQLKNDTVETPPKLNNTTTTTVVKKKAPAPTSNTSTPLPPAVVAKAFKTKYPAATEVVWTKRMPTVKVKNKNTRDYKVHFTLDDKNNSQVYAENGTLIETREQILPDQLPPNISTAIKSKYPDSSILSAATIRNSKIQASFIAVIKTEEYPEGKELMLQENGTFVE